MRISDWSSDVCSSDLVGVAAAAVAAEVHARIGLEVGVDEALVVTMHGAHLAGPGIKHDQVAFGLAFKDLSIGVDDRRLHAEERPGGRYGIGRDRAGKRGEDRQSVVEGKSGAGSVDFCG